MDYISTTGNAPPSSLKGAIRNGLAPDGGLYVPRCIPMAPDWFWKRIGATDLPTIAFQLLAPFTGEELEEADLRSLIAKALDFPIPLVQLGKRVYLLELFHGPTLAFKDVGARFLAGFLEHFREPRQAEITIIVATSGDTGSAVADAFFMQPHTKVLVLYPHGQITRLQEHQFASLGGNVQAIAVEGTFDDCQRLVKLALGDQALIEDQGLTSANSINIGRFLPQMIYYAWAYSQIGNGSAPVYCVPSGNLGNLSAGLMVQKMGLPCRHLVAAGNANAAFKHFLDSGTYIAQKTKRTLATAMDVGNPSNVVRIQTIFDGDIDAIRKAVTASNHTDDQILDTIDKVYTSTGTILDPHTAVGYIALTEYLSNDSECEAAILLSTAHPAKFPEVVAPIVGSISIPDSLKARMARPVEKTIIAPRFEDLRQHIVLS